MEEATIIGAGVIGLTAALALEEAGFNVRIIADAKGAATTSFAAGAVWFPFRADPPERVNRWASRTRDWLERIASRFPEAGVDMLHGHELADGDERPWWAGAVSDLELVEGKRGGARYAWRFRAPRVEPRLFLPWAESRLRAKVEVLRIASFDEIEGVVINCAGLRARELTGDSQLSGLFGQTVIVEPGEIDMGTHLGDERDDSRLFYAIPRRAEVVLGGCAIPWPDGRPVEAIAGMREEILARAAALGVRPGAVVRDSVGLRPFRAQVRVEREGRIVHNYGHGGAGYTLAWGCALEVVELARAARESLRAAARA